MIKADTIFDFIGYHGCASCCRVRVFDLGAAPVVVMTETNANDGTSVTNAAETIAAEVCDFYQLDAADVVFVEHYPDRRGATLHDPIFAEKFAAINFDITEKRGYKWRIERPRWAHLSREEVEALTGQKWEPESE